MKSHLWHKIIFSVIGLVLLVLFTACAGVGTNGSPTSITGTISSVNAANHSVTLSVSGQSYTINGLSDQEIQALQNQVGKTYTIRISQNSDGSYSITAGTNPTQEGDETPGVNETPSSNETPSTTGESDSISFTGPVQSTNSSSLTVKMPDGSSLTMAINAQTDQSDLKGTQLSAGQQVKVDAAANSGGFTATKIKLADSSDQTDANTVEFQGKTTQAVGSDHILHFTVGSKAYSYAINSTADLGDFNGNVSSIASGTLVKVKVQFSGTTGSVVKVNNASN